MKNIFSPHSSIISSTSLSIVALLWSLNAISAPPGWWASVEGGATFTTEDDKTHTAAMPNPPLEDLYDDYKTTDRDNGYLVGVSAGYQFGCPKGCEKKWLPNARVGLGYEFVGETNVSGDIHKYQEQTYYKFNYKTYSQVAWALGQLDILTWKNFTPFIDAALGVSFNSTRDYDEDRISSNVPVRESAHFGNETTSAFAWRAGLGVNYSVPQYEDWTLGLLYRYSDLGDAKTAHSKTYPTVGHLSLPIQNTELLLQLRYDF